MKKRQNQAFWLLLSAAAIAQLGLAYGAATPDALTKGAWSYQNGTWAFYNESQVPVTGWVHSASGWYYMDPADGTMATGWKEINGIRYYFNTASDGLAGQMRTGWYQAPDGSWFFFNNNASDASLGSMLKGWQWIDGYCYFFQTGNGADAGKLLSNTTSPDGFLLNAEGQWTDANGTAQVRMDLGFRTITPANAEAGNKTGYAVSGSSGDGGSTGGGGNTGGGSTVPSAKPQAAEAKQTADGGWSLVKTEGTDDETFSAYLSSITAVKVDGTEYLVSGQDAVSIVDPETGAVKLDAEAGGKPLFEAGKTYQLEVIAAGYEENLSFAMTVAQEKPSEGEKELEGQETVQNYGYDVKLKVKYDSAADKIISVTDNGTVAAPGSESFWTNGQNFYKKLPGLSREQAAALRTEPGGDHTDAVSGATYSSDAIRKAVLKALDGASGKPAAPGIAAKDRRTKLLYAANDKAELQASAEEGSQIVYTTDGSDPTDADNPAGKLAEDGLITLEPKKNADESLNLKLAAKKGEVCSDVTEAEVEFIGIPKAPQGIKVYEGSAPVSTPSGTPYEAKLRITTTDGVITKVEDNGTKTLDIRDESFWGPYLFNPAEEGINERFSGKKLDELINAKTTPGEEEADKIDAITGATVSSDAAKYAAINALRAEPVEELDDKVLAPEVEPSRNYGYVTNTGMSIRLTVSAGAGTTVYYTTDGTEPTEDPEEKKSKKVQFGKVNLYESEPAALRVRFAAFDENGNRSRIVERYCVFTDGAKDATYETGTYESEADGVGVKLVIESGYGTKPIASSIELDADSEKLYAEFLPELLAEVYLKQTADIEPLAAYDAKAQEKVLNAIQKAFDQAVEGGTPEIPETPETGAADGTWYGTARIGRNYEEKGPDVVKVVVEDGKIKSAESILYCEDAGYEYGADGIMKLVKGMTLDEVTALDESFETDAGNAPDAVSHATDSAKGHLSAILNALERAEKFSSDGEEQELAYMDFVKKPNPQQTTEKLDLSGTVLRLYFTDGSNKEVPYDELSTYGVLSTPEHGEALPDSEDSFLVHFTEEKSLADIPARVQRQTAKEKAYASYMEVLYEDGTSEKVELDKKKFRYELKTDKAVKAVELYSEKEEKVADAVHETGQGEDQWIFNMKQVPVEEGYEKWYYAEYYLEVKLAEDQSPIKSFQLIENQLKREYQVGDKLDLSGIHIYARTEAGSELDLKTWEACVEAGFEIDPPEAEDYVFEEAGMKDIIISLQVGDTVKTDSYNVRVTGAKEAKLPAADKEKAEESAADAEKEEGTSSAEQEEQSGADVKEEETASDDAGEAKADAELKEETSSDADAEAEKQTSADGKEEQSETSGGIAESEEVTDAETETKTDSETETNRSTAGILDAGRESRLRSRQRQKNIIEKTKV